MGFFGADARGGEEAGEGVVAGGVEVGEAELNRVRVVAEAEGAEEAVPDGEEGAVVGIGLGLPAGVVDFVDEGGDEEDAQAAVEARTEAEVGVLKLDGGEHEGFVEGEFGEAESEQRDDGDAEDRGDDDFTHVEAVGGGDIHVGVGVVGAVKIPEEGDAMTEAVPGVHPGIEEENGGDEAGPVGERQPVEDAEGMGGGPVGDAAPSEGEEGGGEQGVEEAEGEVACAVRQAFARGTGEEGEERRGGFPCEQRDEHGEREGRAVGGFERGEHGRCAGEHFRFASRGEGKARGNGGNWEATTMTGRRFARLGVGRVCPQRAGGTSTRLAARWGQTRPTNGCRSWTPGGIFRCWSGGLLVCSPPIALA